MSLNERQTSELRASLQEAVVKCSERCLYQSAKWYSSLSPLKLLYLSLCCRAAELLTSLPPLEVSADPEDSQMTEVPLEGLPPIVVTGNLHPEEAQLEAKEINRYLLAKSFFDCREFDRCAAVFLPDTILSGILSASTKPPQIAATPKGKGKGKALVSDRTPKSMSREIPRLSQKSLFLALYAKYMSGEKKKDEDSEMVMGPHDGGSTVNKQLVTISQFLEVWFEKHTTDSGDVERTQGWLEYLCVELLAPGYMLMVSVMG
jgi:anaphase-promoting complex subunit 8